MGNNRRKRFGLHYQVSTPKKNPPKTKPKDVKGEPHTDNPLIRLYLKLEELYQDYKAAELDIQSLINSLEARCAHVLMKQADFDRCIGPLLGQVPHNVLALRNAILNELDHRISEARKALSKYAQEERLKRSQKIQFVLRQKKDIEKTIKLLEATVETFVMNQKTILGLLPLDNTGIDRELDRLKLGADRAFREAKRVGPFTSKRQVMLEPSVVTAYKTQDILYSSGAKRAWNPQDPMSLCIIDSDASIPAEGMALQYAQELALKLHSGSAEEFGLLPYKGVIRRPKTITDGEGRRTITMIFKFPQRHDTVNSLRGLLLQAQGSLVQTHQGRLDRLAMAKHLVKAVFSVHLYDFVHKNIRPETWMCFGTVADGRLPKNAFLIGFEVLRGAKDHSDKGQTLWAQEAANLYQHPRRQREDLNDSDLYHMQHDIYSLGVCLLEIGLWTSFVKYDNRGASVAENLRLSNGRMPTPDAIKDHLMRLAASQLAYEMGEGYSEVVRMCLTCLDGGKGWPTEDDYLANPDVEAVVIRSSYTRDVLAKINNIMDEDMRE